MIGTKRLSYALDHASMALQGRIQLGQFHCCSQLDAPRMNEPYYD